MSTAEKIRAIPIDRTGTYIREVTPAAIRDETACIAEQADAEHAAAMAAKDEEIAALRRALQQIATPALGGKQQQWIAQQALAAARKEPNG